MYAYQRDNKCNRTRLQNGYVLVKAMRNVLARETSRAIARLARTVEEGISGGSLPTTLNPRGTATTLYQLWLGASLRGKITRDREPMGSALKATKAEGVTRPDLTFFDLKLYEWSTR